MLQRRQYLSQGDLLKPAAGERFAPFPQFNDAAAWQML
jgi:hypothetical protein